MPLEVYTITEERIRALSPAAQQIARDCIRYELWVIDPEDKPEAKP